MSEDMSEDKLIEDKPIENEPARIQPEFSRHVAFDRIGIEPLMLEIEAQPGERKALAKRLKLKEISALKAIIYLQRIDAAPIFEVRGEISAALVQSCVVTLEPVPATVHENFDTLLAPLKVVERLQKASSQPELDDFPEPLTRDAIDIGEITAQYLSLGLDPYPRKDGADFVMPEGLGGNLNPFAALKALLPKTESRQKATDKSPPLDENQNKGSHKKPRG